MSNFFSKDGWPIPARMPENVSTARITVAHPGSLRVGESLVLYLKKA